MKEKDLENECFHKVSVPNCESQNGYDYYFYEKGICDDITLYSSDSIDVKDDNWAVYCWEIPSIKITSIEKYLEFVELMNNITCP